MSDDQFEDRVNAAFNAEARALAERQAMLRSSVEGSPQAALIEASTSDRPSGDGGFALSLAAAAVLLLVGIAGVIALGRSGEEALIPVAGGGVRPLVTATPVSGATPAAVVAVEDIADHALIHVVLVGDSLGSIARRYKVSIEAILTANPDLEPSMLFAGQQLWIPALGGQREPATQTPAVTPLPAATALAPLPTAVPVTPVATATPVPPGFVVTEPVCLVRDTPWLPSGTCGLEVIGPILGEQIPVQLIDEGGRVEAGYLPFDALVPGDARPQAAYQPGLLEDSWCVVDIFAPDTLNVRQGPSTVREIVGELTEGQCRIYRTEAPGSLTFDGWTAISVDQPGGAPLSGWAASRYLRRDVERAPSETPMQTLSVRVVPLDPSFAIPAIEEFELFDGRLRLGKPNADGVIEIPAATDPFVVGASAPVEGDRFCAWSGALGPTDSSGYHVITVAMLCA